MPATAGYWLWPTTGFTYTGQSVVCCIEWFPAGTMVSPFTTATFTWQYGTTSGVQAIGTSASASIPGTQSSWTTQTRFYNTQITYTPPPATCPTLSAPANLATDVSLSPTLTWTAGTNTSTYDVYLSTNQTDVNNQAVAALVSSNQIGTSYTAAGLLGSTVYYWRIVPKNAAGTPATGCTTFSFTTAAPSPTLSVAGTLSFSNQCVNTTSNQSSFTVSGVYLTNSVSIGAVTGYTYSTNVAGPYTSTLTLTPSSGTLGSTTIFVRFIPTSATTFNGPIVVSSTGAPSQNVAVSAAGVNASISSQPSSAAVTYCNGTTATALSVTAATAGGSSYSYQWYSNAANSNSGGTLIANATSASYTPPTTSNGTTYYYCVVSGCGTSTATSAVSGAINVVSCCTHTVQMYDSYGDGWNGGTMNVSVNGTVVTTIGSTFTTGFGPIAATFSAPTGATISVSMNAGGSYPEERYISVLSGTGATLVSNWYPFNSGTWSGTANCPPSMDSFSPASVCAGGTITISGTNFSAAVTGVTVNGSAVSSFTVVNSTTITAVTTSSQTSGAVAITYAGGSSSSGSITVNPQPSLTSSGTINAVCSSTSSQTTTLAYTATSNSPTRLECGSKHCWFGGWHAHAI
jgi:hypothetical protein